MTQSSSQPWIWCGYTSHIHYRRAVLIGLGIACEGNWDIIHDHFFIQCKTLLYDSPWNSLRNHASYPITSYIYEAEIHHLFNYSWAKKRRRYTSDNHRLWFLQLGNADLHSKSPGDVCRFKGNFLCRYEVNQNGNRSVLWDTVRNSRVS